MYRQSVNINTIIAAECITATAARLFYIINQLVTVSANRGIKDRRGVPFCYASKKRLAEMLEKSERTTARALAELKEAGMIESRRTTRNAHLYITYYAVCGSSPTAKNGSSNNSTFKRKYNQVLKSIHPAEYIGRDMMDNAQEGEKATGNAQERPQEATEPKGGQVSTHGSGHAQGGHRQPQRATQRADGPRISSRQAAAEAKQAAERARAAREAARRRYVETLERRLKLDSIDYTFGLDEEYDRLEQLVGIIADAMTTENGRINVNGHNMTQGRYWEMVQFMEPRHIYDMLERIRTAEITRGVKNLRAYTLAAVYNAVQYGRLMEGVGIAM